MSVSRVFVSEAEKEMEAVMPGLKVAPRPDAMPFTQDSFDGIYEMYKEPVFRLARALTDNARDAEDLFQETWLRAVRSGREELRSGDTRAWLFTITANLHRDGLRKKRIRRLFFLERARAMTDEAADADSGWESGRFSARDFAAREDLRLCLRRAISRLPARQREVFVLKDIEGYRHAEIGRMLGIPETTVRTLLHRAVNGLQRDLAAFRPPRPRTEASEENKP
jgi:RNA polymerase sigma-70 factor (ECF subfamily)